MEGTKKSWRIESQVREDVGTDRWSSMMEFDDDKHEAYTELVNRFNLLNDFGKLQIVKND